MAAGSPRTCSGAAYAGVARRSPVRVRSTLPSIGSSCLAMPKSRRRIAPPGLDQDIRRLQVPMKDGLPVGVLHGLAYGAEQPQPLFERRAALIAVIDEGPPFD